MFTIEQIKAAHSKVKSGADFPQYIRDIMQLGVTSYETYVIDGHSVYLGEEGYQVASDAKYPALAVANASNREEFQQGLKEHQQGKTDFLGFCGMAADQGVEKWVVDIEKMTCTYFDKRDNEMLEEQIPG
ncbi:MAG TPA: DUF1398 family protein [Puia sp.]|jgi:uncharacterized protein YbcV (DUF1398 family)